jgi:hypothetical protein
VNKFFYQDVHMAMGTITRMADRDRAVDFTYPYFVSMVGIISLKPKLLPKHMAILWPFQKEIWMCLVLSLVVGVVAYWMLSVLGSMALGEKDSIDDDLSVIIFRIASPLVGQGPTL